MISADLLRRVRNDLPMPVTIAALGREGPPAKMSEGYFRFVCSRCGEMRATVNPRNNLAHCFCCQKNLNNIDAERQGTRPNQHRGRRLLEQLVRPCYAFPSMS